MKAAIAETIIKHLEKEIPPGPWCNNGGREKWCPFFEQRHPKIVDGVIVGGYCKLQEEFVNRKTCGINDF